jgi:cobaltochelatase CobN
LSLAVAKARGRAPDTLVADQRTPERIAVEDLARTLGREMRVRYFNPVWIAGMQAEDYAGAREMAHFVEYMWGWQVTTPAAVTATQWEQTFAVYVQDTYGLGLKDFFNRHNPWAYQSITARMLEAVRKEYWTADETTRRKLAAEYAVNVVEKGVACCDHTCNNPMLNQMVASIISVPGVLSPEMVEKFKLAVEKAAAKSLEQQTADRQQLLEQLTASLGNLDPSAAPEKKQEPNQEASAENVNAEQAVEGLKMEDMNTQDDTTDLTSSGIQWAASLFVLALVGLFFFGLKRRR